MLRKIILLISVFAFFTLAFTTSDITKSKPSPQKDNFSKWPDFGEGQDWRYYIVDGNSGAISVNGALPFDNSTAEVTSGKELHLLQVYDADFEEEFPAQYNNIFMIGFQGYAPNTARDIIWNFDMRIEPGTYGSTGFVVQPKDTFAPDGTVALPLISLGSPTPERKTTPLDCAASTWSIFRLFWWIRSRMSTPSNGMPMRSAFTL